MSQEMFTITSSSYTLEFGLPEYGGAGRTLTKNITLFNFWKGDIDTTDKGVDTEPLVLGGIELLKGDNIGLCFPLCFSRLCFSTPLSNKVENMWTLMNNGEEVTITDLGDTLDAVYIVKNFEFKTIKGLPFAFAYRMELEYKREIL